MVGHKAQNKYHARDLDPSKLPKGRKPENQQKKSIRCNTCGNYISEGTKFNSRKEDAVGENYFEEQILRFYFKCPKCSVELVMRTDPQNSDYVVEAGARRNFEPWRNEDKELDEENKKREAEENGDNKKSLENRTRDSKREMNNDATNVSDDDKWKALEREHKVAVKEKSIQEEDEATLKSVVFHNSKDYVRR
ncbi:hypothetical protein PRUPE_1G288200 [Prunus persica]|uniref:Splicing factor YJU2 n=1 Tax=Prunus persica TaxID=3760 RepID=A0A251R7F0_PRUPE|nr:hypothetical protein PRUPE_1G288200 [Prunus persica]